MDKIDKLHTLRRNVQEQKKNLQQEIVHYYDSTFKGNKTKTILIDLHIPKDIHTGKGQMVIDSMKAYLRGRAAEYYAIIPYLHRISDVVTHRSTRPILTCHGSRSKSRG